MQKKTVVDSSVIIKWLNADNEQNLQEADLLLQKARNGEVELFSPELAKYEVGNVLLKGKHFRPDQAKISLGTAYSLPITYIPDSEKLANETFSLAHLSKITYYDASFVSLAHALDANLVTANPKHQAVSGTVSVSPIQDYK